MSCPFPLWSAEARLVTPRVLQWTEEAVPSDSRWLRAVRARFRLSWAAGHEHVWDLSPGLDAVAVLVFVPEWDGFVLVRQFRAAAFRRVARDALAAKMDESGTPGMTFEAVAGLADKGGLSRLQTAVEELHEEIGAKVEASRLEEVVRTLGGVGTAASELSVFYLEAHPGDFVPGAGGGLAHEGEVIQQVLLPRKDLDEFMYGAVSRPSSLVGMLEWWRRREAERATHALAAGAALAVVSAALLGAVAATYLARRP
jgi:8-oxo-dGTP pyrophosphatase MutT (NUDIX family)